MKKILVVLVCLCLVQCGNSKKEVEANYQSLFSDCLDKKDVERINQGVDIFNSTLKEYYQVEGNLEAATYKKYFDEFSEMTLPRRFFINQKAISFLKELQKTSTFQKLFILYEEQQEQKDEFEEEIPITERIDEEEIVEIELPDFYTLNVKGEFMNCLLNKSKNEDVKSYIEGLKIASDLAPNIKTYALSEMITKVDSEADQKILITSATFDIFFGAIFMFNQFK